MVKYPTKAELLALIARSTFRPFTNSDWDAFAGCESADPLIAEDGDYVIVLDGDQVNVLHADDEFGGQLFDLNQLA